MLYARLLAAINRVRFQFPRKNAKRWTRVLDTGSQAREREIKDEKKKNEKRKKGKNSDKESPREEKEREESEKKKSVR